MIADAAADEALRALESGALDRAEGLLREALVAARAEARRSLEIRVACALGELLVTTGDVEQGLLLFQHLLERLAELPPARRDRLASERATALRYVGELAPTDDPDVLEWGD